MAISLSRLFVDRTNTAVVALAVAAATSEYYSVTANVPAPGKAKVGVTESPDVVTTPEVADSPEGSKTSEVSESLDAVNSPEAAESLATVKTPETAESLESTEAPKVEEIPGFAKSPGDDKENIELRVPLCCEGCAEKVIKTLRNVEGVVSVLCDMENQKVTVRGKAEPLAVLEKVRKIQKRSEVWSD